VGLAVGFVVGFGVGAGDGFGAGAVVVGTGDGFAVGDGVGAGASSLAQPKLPISKPSSRSTLTAIQILFLVMFHPPFF